MPDEMVNGSNFQTSSLTKTATNVLTSSIKIASANAKRIAFIVFNNSANSCYVCFENPAIAAGCARIIATFTSWEYFYPVIYTGDIYCIRNSGTGNCVVWEFNG